MQPVIALMSVVLASFVSQSDIICEVHLLMRQTFQSKDKIVCCHDCNRTPSILLIKSQINPCDRGAAKHEQEELIDEPPICGFTDEGS